MTNGCICCTLRDDLLKEVSRLAREQRFDYLLIESTGISEPLPVAATFTFTDETGSSLSEVAQLDTMVTVVDAAKFLDDAQSADDLGDRKLALDSEDERTLSDLLIDQVEFADVIVINKTDTVSSGELMRLESVLRILNPAARIVHAQYGRVPLDHILNTGFFDMEAAESSAGWVRELNGIHTPETEEYGISSFVYQARRPFHPERLDALTDAGFPGVLRAKGFLWLASRQDDLILFSIAGKTLTVEPQAHWLAADAEDQAEDAETGTYLEKVWQEPYGDRRQEIVFIGMQMDREAIRSSACRWIARRSGTRLDDALLTADEIDRRPRGMEEMERSLP